MGKWKPWYYIPNQSKYDTSFWGATTQNDVEQDSKLQRHNDKQRKYIQRRKK